MTDELDGEREREVICDDCGEPATLTETPYDTTEFTVSCACQHKAIDVTMQVNSHNLLEPMTGKWSTFDKGSDLQGSNY